MSARSIIRALGGIRPTARTLGHATHSTVQGWWVRDVIPAQQQAAVFGAAKASGIAVDPGDLIPGFDHATKRNAA